MPRSFYVTFAVLAFGGLSFQAQSPKTAAVPTKEAKSIWEGIVVANLETSAQWYQQKLGFKVTKKIDAPEHKLRIMFLDLSGFMLELIEFRDSVSFATVQKSMPELKDRDHLQGFVKMGFQIPDVDALAASLKASGVKLRMDPTDDREFHDRFLLVEDPDGNTLQFFQLLK